MTRSVRIKILVMLSPGLMICGCSQLGERVRAMEEERTELLSEVTRLNAQLVGAEENAAEARASIDKLAKKLEQAIAGADSSRANFEESKRNAGKCEQELVEQKTLVLRARAELEALKMRIAMLEKALQDGPTLPLPPILPPERP